MKNVNRGNCVCGGRGWNKYENSILKKKKKSAINYLDDGFCNINKLQLGFT